MLDKPEAEKKPAGARPPGAAGHSRAAAEPKVYDTGTPEDRPAESGGPAGPEPTRYGDWERKGRCIDF